MYGADGRSHSICCRARRRKWIDEGQPAPTAPMKTGAGEADREGAGGGFNIIEDGGGETGGEKA